MIRLGIVDFDTSHVVEFTKRLNHKGIGKDQWVDGAEITLGCPGESQLAPERIAGYQKEMERLGVELVKTPARLIGKVDGVLVESLEGGAHLARVKPFLEAGMPCYVDKPFACSVKDAREMAELRKRIGAFTNSRHRTDYPSYRRNGWDVGCGPTEAGRKIIRERLKGSGIRWVEDGAGPAASLRALYVSGGKVWDGFWAQPRRRAA